jgi:hypothetical protein
MIMYGGQNAGPLADIWAFDLAADTWTDLTPATGPIGRFFAASVYDSAHHRLTVFGGVTTGGVTSEAWIFDLVNDAWLLLAPGGTPPSARDGSAAIYDGALDRMVVFGGQDLSWRNDVWALEHLSDTVGIPPAPPARSFTLHPGAPNPFNGSTAIAFELSRGAHVTLRIHDVRGRSVRTLIDAQRPAGPNSITWDGLDDRGRPVGSGVYLCQLVTGGEATARRLVRVR